MINYANMLRKEDLFELYKKMMTTAEALSHNEANKLTIVDKDWKENIPISHTITSTGNYLLLARDEEQGRQKCEILRVDNFQCALSSIDYHGRIPEELEDVFISFMLKKMPADWKEGMINHKLEDTLVDVGFYVNNLYKAAVDFRQKCGDKFDYVSQKILDEVDALHSHEIINHYASDYVVSVCEKKVREHINELQEEESDDDERSSKK